jgi:hypothetical protein
VALAAPSNELALQSEGISIAFCVALAASPNEFTSQSEAGSIVF